MKRWMALLMAAVCALSLTGCKAKGPGQEEVEEAIAEGNVTLQDAVDKGWITQEWADAYILERSVPAADKIEFNRVGEFTTTTLAGEEFTGSQMEPVSFFAFVDPKDAAAPEYFGELVKAYEGVKENGAGIVVCLKGETEETLYKDAPFPVILYNDSVKQAVQNDQDLIESMANTGSWYTNGSFLSAWYGKVEAQDLIESAAAFVGMTRDNAAQGEEDENGSAAAMVG